MKSKDFKLNIKQSPVDERDYVAETIYSSEGDLPAELDLRSQLQPVRNQGSQGTCAAQTAACMKEWQELRDVRFKEHMSPQFIYNIRFNQDSSGMYSRDVMKILHKIGSVRESAYPYNTSEPVTEGLKSRAAWYRIEGYAAVNTVEGLKKALVKNGPCYIAIPTYNYGMRMWKPRQGDTALGGHAMTVVGYNKQGFLIRNSWGANWGDGGYTVFPYEDWGLHWEFWTTIDADSGNPPAPEEEDKKTKSLWQRIVAWFKKLFQG
jgi:C1A family cysteine protease